MGRRVRLELLFDLFLVLLGIVITVISYRYGFGSLKRPGPGLYPFFIGTAVLILSLFVAISEIKSKTVPHLMDKEGIKIFVLMTVTFCLWILIMPLLGYVIVTLLATFVACVIFVTVAMDHPFRGDLGIPADAYQLIYDHLMNR